MIVALESTVVLVISIVLVIAIVIVPAILDALPLPRSRRHRSAWR